MSVESPLPLWLVGRSALIARLELKALIAKGERGLTKQDLKVVKTQRP